MLKLKQIFEKYFVKILYRFVVSWTYLTKHKIHSIKFFFKCENLQKTGAFKARGACNASLLAKESGVSGVVTHSSGNHGQAVAWAASKEVADLDCTVVVPKGTPQVKCEAIRQESLFCA